MDKRQTKKYCYNLMPCGSYTRNSSARLLLYPETKMIKKKRTQNQQRAWGKKNPLLQGKFTGLIVLLLLQAEREAVVIYRYKVHHPTSAQGGGFFN